MITGTFSRLKKPHKTMLDGEQIFLDPEERLRNIIQEAVYPETISQTSSLELYYIRCVNNNQTVFTPTFMYLIDLGLPTYAGVVVPYETLGTGDPSFPNFDKTELFSVVDKTPTNLLYPYFAGKIAISVGNAQDDETVINDLSEYANNVKKIFDGLYSGECTPFYEKKVIDKILKNISYVNHVEQDAVLRIITVTPGWKIDRII